MPLVRISLREGTTPEYRRAIADGVHRALLEALAVPVDDRFQVITEHDAEGLIYDPQYLGIQRSDRVVFVQNHSERRSQTAAETPALQAHGRDIRRKSRLASRGPGDQSR